MNTEHLKTAYEPKILAILTKVAEEARARGYDCSEPDEWTDECYKWNAIVHPKGKDYDEGVDVSIEIAESTAYDGTDEGVSFRVDLVCYGGRILGSFAPYNYTPEVWVPHDDEDAVAARWDTFIRGFEPSDILDTIHQDMERRTR